MLQLARCAVPQMTGSNQLIGSIPTELVQLTSLTDLEFGKTEKSLVALILVVIDAGSCNNSML
jgi:hypothetical protein